MSAHTWISVGGHLNLLTARETYLPEVAALFTEDEARSAAKDEFQYISSVRAILDRLQVHGVTRAGAVLDLERAVSEYSDESVAQQDAQPDITAEKIIGELHRFANGIGLSDFASYDMAEPLCQLDAWTVLRIALDTVVDDSMEVRYQLGDLRTWELLQPGTSIAELARQERTTRVSIEAPLIVLTEGSSDASLLGLALTVTHPHLVEFIRFMDFSGGAEGGVGNLAKLVVAFEGARVANRVVALADNDTAAHAALKKLKKAKLSDNVRIRHYPEISLLSDYPTLGPQGDSPVLMDVNGKAGSLEMYLGSELLENDGQMVPVQWTGYVADLKTYQGAIDSHQKRRIQDEFRRKAQSALSDPRTLPNQDWTGVHAIIATILNAFDTP